MSFWENSQPETPKMSIFYSVTFTHNLIQRQLLLLVMYAFGVSFTSVARCVCVRTSDMHGCTSTNSVLMTSSPSSTLPTSCGPAKIFLCKRAWRATRLPFRYNLTLIHLPHRHAYARFTYEMSMNALAPWHLYHTYAVHIRPFTHTHTHTHTNTHTYTRTRNTNVRIHTDTHT